MRKTWVSKLAGEVEMKYGKEVSNRIFGDFHNVPKDPDAEKEWFYQFTKGMDELGDKEFLTSIMAKHCPCGYNHAVRSIKKYYEQSTNTQDFVKQLDESGEFGDFIELKENVMYATKPPMNHKQAGSCGKGCHCSLARLTDKLISDIFCYCCTVGYYKKMFKKALGVDVNVEFVDSIVTGGKGCTAAIHLPERDSLGY